MKGSSVSQTMTFRQVLKLHNISETAAFINWWIKRKKIISCIKHIKWKISNEIRNGRSLQLYSRDCVGLCSEFVLSSRRWNVFIKQVKEQQRYINMFFNVILFIISLINYTSRFSLLGLKTALKCSFGLILLAALQISKCKQLIWTLLQ